MQLKDELEMSNGVISMIGDMLGKLGCSHTNEHTRAATPPMMYPEWIVCVVAHHKKKGDKAATILEAQGWTYQEEHGTWVMVPKAI